MTGTALPRDIGRALEAMPMADAQPLADGRLAAARATIAAESEGLRVLAAALGDSGSALGRAFDMACATIMAAGGRVVVSGIGKSGHIGRKIQATLASTGTPSLFVHPAEASHGDLGMIATGDVLLMLSQSGETAELADVLAHAHHHGIPVLSITGAADSTLARASTAALVMPAAAEACPMGLAPTTSTLMQLAIGDALAIALLHERGFTVDAFGAFHPGGRLGARLRSVASLMHTGAALPLGTPDDLLPDVILEMTRKAFGCIGIVDETGRLVGLITDADLRRALDRDLRHTRARDVMNHSPVTTTPDALAREALLTMNVRSKPITSLFALAPSGRPVGILHLHDLLRAGVAA